MTNKNTIKHTLRSHSLAGKTVAALFAIVLAFSISLVTAQTSPIKQWDARYGGSDEDYLYSLQQTTDGGYILGGTSYSGISGDKTQASQGNSDYWIVKTDSNGVKQWDARFGGSSEEYFSALQQTTDGGYILGGTSFSGISGDKTQASQGGLDYWIVKTDANGVKQWDARFGGNNVEEFASLQQTSDGGYILGGYSYSGISGDKTQGNQGYGDYWIVKIAANGVKQWDARFGGSNDDYFSSLQQTTDGGYILGGYSQSGISGDKTKANWGYMDYWIIKTDANGVKQWDADFGGNGFNVLFSIQQTTDGGYILGGGTDAGISGDKTEASKGYGDDYWVVKLDGSGAIQWQNTIGGDQEDWLSSIRQTTDGGYILSGNSYSDISFDKTEASKGSTDYWVVKLGSTGVIEWQKDLGSSDDDYVYSVQQTTDGGYFLGGSTYSGISGDKTETSQGGNDYWVVKLSAVCFTGVTVYADADGDGYGNPSISSTNTTCDLQNGYVVNSTDCNDLDAAVSPGTAEICNGIDDNCNGSSDEGLLLSFYADADIDGYGNPNMHVVACTIPLGYVNNFSDCNDADANIYPTAIEVCNNSIDDNCNGQIDEVYSYAQGDPDLSYGSSGILHNGLSNNTSIVSQDNGKYTVSGSGFYFEQVDEDGTSNSFGGNIDGTCTSLALQADGKIVAGGYYYDWSAQTDYLVVARYNVDGSPDTSFSGDGVATISGEVCNSLAIQPDSKIVAVGYGPYNGRMVAVRFNSDGSTDFNVSYNFGDFGDYDVAHANSVVIQSDGKIFLVGDNDGYYAALRLNSNGSFDKEIKTSVLSGSEYAVAQQTDGKIIAAGTASGNLFGTIFYNQLAVVRYNTDGSLDNTFGEDGIFFLNLENAWGDGRTMLLRDNGKILAAGSLTDTTGLTQFALYQLKNNGTLDSLFSDDGIATSLNFQCAYGRSLSLNPAGEISVCGNDNYSGATARFHDTNFSNAISFYQDADEDGYGNSSVTTQSCSAPIGYVSNNTDCNDANASINPASPEICSNGVDDNCNGQIDENCNATCDPPSSFSVSNITSSSAKLKWNAVTGAEKYKLRYKVSGSNEWTILNPVAHSKTITGLSANTSYKWQVKTICQIDSPNVTSDWSAKQSFTTLSLKQNSSEVTSVFEVSLAPNPSTGIIALEIESSQQQSLSIKLFDVLGREVFAEDEGNVSGAFSKQLDLSNLPSGTYFLKVMHGGVSEMRKVVVEK